MTTAIVGCFATVFTCGGVVAQQPPPDGLHGAGEPVDAPATSGDAVPLTLRQAVQMALRENPQVLRSRLEALGSRRDRDGRLALLLPQAGFSGTIGENRFNQQSIIGNEKPVQVGPYQVINAGGNFSQELLDLPTVRRYQAAREGVRTASAQSELTREQIVASVVGQYLSVLRAIATWQAAIARRDLAERLYRQAAQLQKNGVGTGLDALRSNVELQNERQRVIDAESSARTAIYGLTALLALPRGQEARVTEPVQFQQLPDPDVEQEIDKALVTRPEMISILSQQRAASFLRRAAEEQRLPSLSFSGYYRYQARTLDTGIPAYNYTGAINLPVLTGGRIRAEIGRARIEEEKLEAQRRETEITIRQQVKTAVEQLHSAGLAVQVANAGLDLARQEVAQAQRRFEAGVSTNIDVISAQDALARASDNQIESLYRFNQSRADLARAVGEAERVYGP